jgi:hypothetical protein
MNYQHSPSQQKTDMQVNQSSLFTTKLRNKRIARTTKEINYLPGNLNREVYDDVIWNLGYIEWIWAERPLLRDLQRFKRLKHCIKRAKC